MARRVSTYVEKDIVALAHQDLKFFSSLNYISVCPLLRSEGK